LQWDKRILFFIKRIKKVGSFILTDNVYIEELNRKEAKEVIQKMNLKRLTSDEFGGYYGPIKVAYSTEVHNKIKKHNDLAYNI
jgi:hypothetical protein